MTGGARDPRHPPPPAGVTCADLLREVHPPKRAAADHADELKVPDGQRERVARRRAAAGAGARGVLGGCGRRGRAGRGGARKGQPAACGGALRHTAPGWAHPVSPCRQAWPGHARTRAPPGSCARRPAAPGWDSDSHASLSLTSASARSASVSACSTPVATSRFGGMLQTCAVEGLGAIAAAAPPLDTAQRLPLRKAALPGLARPLALPATPPAPAASCSCRAAPPAPAGTAPRARPYRRAAATPRAAPRRRGAPDPAATRRATPRSSAR